MCPQLGGKLGYLSNRSFVTEPSTPQGSVTGNIGCCKERFTLPAHAAGFLFLKVRNKLLWRGKQDTCSNKSLKPTEKTFVNIVIPMFLLFFFFNISRKFSFSLALGSCGTEYHHSFSLVATSLAGTGQPKVLPAMKFKCGVDSDKRYLRKRVPSYDQAI